MPIGNILSYHHVITKRKEKTPTNSRGLKVGNRAGGVAYCFNPISSIEISRILNFWIFPVTVIGNSSTNL